MKSGEIINIFREMGFEIAGDSIIMSACEAYTFSAITGAKYLFYSNGITAKGRYEVFIHRSVFSNNHLIYSPGLFSRDIDGNILESNSSNILSEKFPHFFKGRKKILIYDVSTDMTSNIENEIHDNLLREKKDPTEYILYKNFISNNVGESLLEYFASLFFIKKGYLVENQAPWFQQNYKYKERAHQGGIPDFTAFHSGISTELLNHGIISKNNGIFIGILPVISLFYNIKEAKDTRVKQNFTYKHELIIGEAKTSKNSLSQALEQLNKYSAVDVANGFFTIIPDSRNNKDHGSMYIDSCKVKLNNLTLRNSNKADLRVKEDSKWIDTYIKMLLLGNISFKNIVEFIETFRLKNKLSLLEKYQCTHLLDAVQMTDNSKFVDYLLSKINEAK